MANKISIATLGIVTLMMALFSGCGYHMRHQEEVASLSIPYVSGDFNGELTNALTQAISNSGKYEYLHSQGDFTLNVTITNTAPSILGYEYSSNNRNLFAIENRTTITALVELTNSSTLESVIPPFTVSASIDFDYANVDSVPALAIPTPPSGKLEPLIRYSLGQFDSIEGAQEEATLRLYKILAQKICSAL